MSRFVLLESQPVRAHVLEAGEGPPMLLLHGGGATAALWGPLLLVKTAACPCGMPMSETIEISSSALSVARTMFSMPRTVRSVSPIRRCMCKDVRQNENARRSAGRFA